MAARSSGERSNYRLTARCRRYDVAAMGGLDSPLSRVSTSKIVDGTRILGLGEGYDDGLRFF